MSLRARILRWGLGLACFWAPADPIRAANEAFRSLEAEADLGWLMPTHGAAGTFQPAPMGGIRLTTSYYGPWKAHGLFLVSRLEGPEESPLVYLAQAGAGLEWAGGPAWAPAPGWGFGVYHERLARGQVGRGREFLASDGESEFGVYPFLRWGLPMGAAWTLHASCQWDLVFSSPEFNQLPSLHIGLGRRIL